MSLWKLRRITNELRDLRDESMKDEASIAELDSEFMSVVQNLVN